MDEFDELPREVIEQLLAFTTEIEGEIKVTDHLGFVKFIVEHGKQYPLLYNLISVNKTAVIEHYKETGEVPPGVKIIAKTTTEGSNVTHLEIIHGPEPPKSK